MTHFPVPRILKLFQFRTIFGLYCIQLFNYSIINQLVFQPKIRPIFIIISSGAKFTRQIFISSFIMSQGLCYNLKYIKKYFAKLHSLLFFYLAYNSKDRVNNKTKSLPLKPSKTHQTPLNPKKTMKTIKNLQKSWITNSMILTLTHCNSHIPILEMHLLMVNIIWGEF